MLGASLEASTSQAIHSDQFAFNLKENLYHSGMQWGP